MNVMGSVYMDSSACPFESVERCLKRNDGRFDFAVLDIHAEATGEKKALAYNFAKSISVCFGTHTHIQTSDARVLEGSCGYITDLGMVGARDSILGVKKENAIYRMKTKMLTKFDFAEGEIEATGAIFELDPDTGKCLSARAISF
jgi:calcineurin-like phosphoesterase